MILIILVLVLAVIIFGVMCGTAPQGYEDESGFHLGEEPRK